MKVYEFIENYNKNKGKLNSRLDEKAIENYIKKTLDVIEYLPIISKYQMAERVIHGCSHKENGVVIVDSFKKYFLFTVAVLQNYTNLEFSDTEEVYEEYDALSASGLLDMILSIIEVDYNRANTILNMVYGDKINENNVINIIYDGIDNITKKIKEIMPIIQQQFKDIQFDQTQELVTGHTNS